MEKKKLILLTDEQEREFERLKIVIRQNSRNSERAVGELLVLLGILMPYEAKHRAFLYSLD